MFVRLHGILPFENRDLLCRGNNVFVQVLLPSRAQRQVKRYVPMTAAQPLFVLFADLMKRAPNCTALLQEVMLLGC